MSPGASIWLSFSLGMKGSTVAKYPYMHSPKYNVNTEENNTWYKIKAYHDFWTLLLDAILVCKTFCSKPVNSISVSKLRNIETEFTHCNLRIFS